MSLLVKFIFPLTLILFSFFAKADSFSLEGEDVYAIAAHIKMQRSKFRKIIGSKELVGMEVLVADSTSSKIESLFGHSAIRFIDNDESEYNDLVLSFQMLALDSSKVNSKALGGWENFPFVYSFEDYLKQYMSNEGRSVKRLIIPTDQEKLENVVLNLATILEVPDIVGDYNFFTNNCLTAIFKVLSDSGYAIHDDSILNLAFGIQVPVLAERVLRKSFIVNYPYINLRSYSGDLQTKAESMIQLEHSYKDINPYHDESLTLENYWRHSSFKDFIKNLTDDEVLGLNRDWPKKWMPVIHLLDNELDKRNLLKNKKANHGAIPKSIYKICPLSQKNCITNKLKSLLEIWTKSDLEGSFNDIEARYIQEKMRYYTMNIGSSGAKGWIFVKEEILNEVNNNTYIGEIIKLNRLLKKEVKK